MLVKINKIKINKSFFNIIYKIVKESVFWFLFQIYWTSWIILRDDVRVETMGLQYNFVYVYVTQIAVKREDAVTKEISRKLAEDKKMSKKEKDER